MARTTEDLRPLLVAATAFDPDDADSIRAPRQKVMAPIAPDRLRVGLLMPLLEAASPAMAATVDGTSRRLAANGATVWSIPSSETFEAGFSALFTIMRAEIATVHADLYRRHRRRYAPQIASIVETGRRIPATEYIRAREATRRYRAELDGWFKDLDVVLAPAAPGAAERSHDTIGDPRMNIPATLAGLPALTIPARLSDDRLPLGIQLIGRRNDDHRLLDIARCLEGLVNFQAAPPVPWTSTD